MKVRVLRDLVENQTLAALKEAEEAILKDKPLAFEVEGGSLSEKLNNIIAAINILEKMKLSTITELIVAMLGLQGKRRYCLYISETQQQADMHVQNIAALFEARHADDSRGGGHHIRFRSRARTQPVVDVHRLDATARSDGQDQQGEG